MKTVDVKKLIPEALKPLRNNRWVMMIEGVDAYLVRTVQPPVIDASNIRRELTVTLYNVVGGDQNERLKAWLDLPTSKAGELKFLDLVGDVVERWTFKAKPEKMWFDKFDYSDVGLMATYVLFDLSEFNITSP